MQNSLQGQNPIIFFQIIHCKQKVHVPTAEISDMSCHSWDFIMLNHTFESDSSQVLKPFNVLFKLISYNHYLNWNLFVQSDICFSESC